MTTYWVMVDEDLEVLYRRYVTELVHFATVLVGPADAVDVVADAVLATVVRASLTGVRDVRAYWFRAVANTAVDLHRSRSRRSRREAASSAASLSVVVLDDADDARRMLAGLSGQQRAVIYLTYWHDLAPDRVAELLGVAEGTVRKQLARGRERLREVLG